VPLPHIAGDFRGQPIWIADAHRGEGKRFIVRADEKLTAFLELEVAAKFLALLGVGRRASGDLALQLD